MRSVTPIATDARLLTIPQVAERLAISARKTWRLISTGQLKTVRVGERGTRVLSRDLDDYIEEIGFGTCVCAKCGAPWSPTGSNHD